MFRPDGSQNASRLQIPSSGSASLFYQLESHSSGTQYTISVYAKSNTGTNQSFRLYGDYGASGNISSDFTATNEWQRFTYTFTASASGSRGTGIYNTLNEAADLQIYGIQFEAGSYATSYIPTSGSSVTRSAEFCQAAGNSTVINKTQGVLFAEIAALADDLTFRQITLNDGGANTILIGYRTNSNRIYSQLVSNNVSQAFIGYDVADITEFHKVAVVYENNRVDLWIDGVKRVTDTSATMPLNLTNIDLESTSGSAQFYAKTKQIKLYDTALSDSELQALTS